MELLKEYLAEFNWKVLMTNGLRILLILVIAWILYRASKILLKRMERVLVKRGQADGEADFEVVKRAETLAHLLRKGLAILIWVMSFLVILRELGFDIAPILASAGIVGLAVGFGAQNLVRDVIAGFFIILENQVRVGDMAVINGTVGLVEKINFRTIVLRDVAGAVHVFPNGTITTLCNLTRDWSAFVFDISIDYKEDADRAMEVLRQVGRELKQDPRYGILMREEIEIFGVDKLTESAVIIKGRLKTQPNRQLEIGREFQRRVKMAFDEAAVVIPFPRMSLDFGLASKPLLVSLNQGEREEAHQISSPAS